MLGQGKFNINSGHGKQCLHMDESHCNALPSNKLRLWRIRKKGKIFAPGRKSRLLAPWFSSLSQLFSAVFQSRAREAQEDLKDEERHTQGPLPGTMMTLRMPQLQEDATDARQSRNAYYHQKGTCLAWQPGRLASYLAVKRVREEGSCCLLMSTDCLDNS